MKMFGWLVFALCAIAAIATAQTVVVDEQQGECGDLKVTVENVRDETRVVCSVRATNPVRQPVLVEGGIEHGYDDMLELPAAWIIQYVDDWGEPIAHEIVERSQCGGSRCWLELAGGPYRVCAWDGAQSRCTEVTR